MGRIKWAELLDMSTNAVSSANVTVTHCQSPSGCCVQRKQDWGNQCPPGGASRCDWGGTFNFNFIVLSGKSALQPGKKKPNQTNKNIKNRETQPRGH